MYDDSSTRSPRGRQRRPYNNDNDNDNDDDNNNSRRRQQQRPTNNNNNNDNSNNRKQQLYALCGALVGIAVWYLTPVSDYVVEVLLLTVPIEADMELGRQAASEFRTQYDPHWTPQLQSIGRELVQSSRHHYKYKDAQH
jgi:hypothetical protein